MVENAKTRENISKGLMHGRFILPPAELRMFELVSISRPRGKHSEINSKGNSCFRRIKVISKMLSLQTGW